MFSRRQFLLSTGIAIAAGNQVARSATPDLRVDPIDYVRNVGRGLNSVLSDLTVDIFRPNVRESSFFDPNTVDVIQLEIVTSQAEFHRATSASAKAKASYGLAKGKASASQSSSISSNSYSCYVFGYIRKNARPLEAVDINIDKDILKFIKRNIKDPLKIERKLGDKVITGAHRAAEITVIAEFQTSSEETKKSVAASLKGSYGSFGGGSAKFAEAIASVRSYSKKTISVYGGILDTKRDLASEAELLALLNDFNVNYNAKMGVIDYIKRDYADLTQLLELPFVNNSNIRLRESFAAQLNSLYQDYFDWLEDIAYVLNPSNASQFEPNVIGQAKGDQEKCLIVLERLKELEERALNAWEEGKDWEKEYSPELLRGFPVGFRIYKQRQSVAEPTPKPRSAPVRPDKGGGVGGGQGH